METLVQRNLNIHRTHNRVKGGVMSAMHFGPVDQAAQLVFLHANGFHGLAYQTILNSLGVHAIGLDLRGHGNTELPAASDHHAYFHNYAQDVANYLNAHIKGKIVLAGHSLGASTAILAAMKAPEKIARVTALDPIVLPFAARIAMSTAIGRSYFRKHFPLSKSAGRRRDEFPSFIHAYKRYHKRGPFKAFSDEALWDYVSGGFIPSGDIVRLACRPLWEQYTYTSQKHDMHRPIAILPESSRLIITNFVSKTTKAPNRWILNMRAKRPDITIEHKPDLDHFFPLLNPSFTIKVLKDSLKQP